MNKFVANNIMTQADKDLLLKDLCARLPHGVKVQIKNEIVVLDSICDDDGYHLNFIGEDREGVNIEDIKPYLLPLSSMTEEQMKECLSTKHEITKSSGKFMYLDSTNTINYYCKNHLDYIGLIPKGLALDATGLNIY